MRSWLNHSGIRVLGTWGMGGYSSFFFLAAAADIIVLLWRALWIDDDDDDGGGANAITLKVLVCIVA